MTTRNGGSIGFKSISHCSTWNITYLQQSVYVSGYSRQIGIKWITGLSDRIVMERGIVA
jgi:hypothetical protein